MGIVEPLLRYCKTPLGIRQKTVFMIELNSTRLECGSGVVPHTSGSSDASAVSRHLAMTAAAHKLPQIPRATAQNLADMSASRTDIHTSQESYTEFPCNVVSRLS